jgi:hypothetical protein
MAELGFEGRSGARWERKMVRAFTTEEQSSDSAEH